MGGAGGLPVLFQRCWRSPHPLGHAGWGGGIGWGIERGALEFVILGVGMERTKAEWAQGGGAKGGMEHAGWGGTIDVEWRWGRGAR